MNTQRLNTQELIQAARSHFDASKAQERLRELQLSLQLKNKEITYLTTQLASNKEDYLARVKYLEKELTQRKKEIAEIRLSGVKAQRQFSEKAQLQISRMRKEHENVSNEKQQEYQHKIQLLKKTHQVEVNSLKEKYENFIKIEKEEYSVCKNIKQEHSNYSNILISQLQEEKRVQTIRRKQAESKAQTYKNALQKLQNEFDKILEEKDENLMTLKGQLEGLKLRQKVLQERIDQQKKLNFDYQAKSTHEIEAIKRTNEKLRLQNTRLKQMFKKREEQHLSECLDTQKNHSQLKLPLSRVYQCTHEGLILQLEKNIELKQAEINELKKVIEQWTSLIGFDRPLSQRLADLSEQSSNIVEINQKWVRKLKQKSKESHRKSIR